MSDPPLVLTPGMQVSSEDGPLGRWTAVSWTPDPRLAPHLAALWFAYGRTTYRRDRILPTGCVHLLINVAAPQYQIDPTTGERRGFGGAFLSGAQDRFVDTEAPDDMALFGVVFRLGGAYPFFGAAQNELSGHVLELEEVLGDRAASLRRHLGERVFESGDLYGAFRVLERFLSTRLERGRASHPVTSWLLERLVATGGTVRVDELARATGFSRKHLATVVRREVGPTLKGLARLLRFRCALAAMQMAAGSGSELAWADLAVDCGYYDQSHLIRDFKTFAGCTPDEARRLDAPDANTLIVE
ncbi:MAG: AraC family transcriptional regulator [Acidobacteriota bacterium]